MENKVVKLGFNLSSEEKALELKAEFFKLTSGVLSNDIRDYWAVRCSQKLVDEILGHLDEAAGGPCHMSKSIAYWKDVKEELEKL